MRTSSDVSRMLARGALSLWIGLGPALVHAAEERHGPAAEAGNPLTRPDPGLIIWTVVTFLILVLLLWWKAWPPIVRALRMREDAVRESIAQARREREEAARLLEQHKAVLVEARKETAGIIEQGRRDAEKVRGEILEKARREQQEFLDQGRRQIEHETRAAILSLKAQAVDLALAASEKLLRRSLDQEAHRRLVEETLREISSGEGGKRSGAH